MDAQLSNPKELLLSGDIYVTLRSKASGVRYTYRIYWGKKKRAEGIEVYYVEVMCGRDNRSGYRYFGWIKDNIFHFDTRNARVTKEANSVIAFEWFWRYVVLAESEKARKIMELWISGKCENCGKKLTVPESIRKGVGPECESYIGARI